MEFLRLTANDKEFSLQSEGNRSGKPFGPSLGLFVKTVFQKPSEAIRSFGHDSLELCQAAEEARRQWGALCQHLKGSQMFTVFTMVQVGVSRHATLRCQANWQL